MKKLIFTSIVFISAVFCAYSTANASSVTTTADPVSPAEEIEIKDITAAGGLLRSAPLPVVSAWLLNAQMNLTFLQDLGMVNITVTGVQGAVYQTSFAAADGAELVIDTEGWSAGDYTITIVRSNGKTFAGDFEL